MVQSKRVKGAGSARPESAPTARRLGREAWRPGSGGARAGNGTWFCGCCAASRLMRSREKSVWSSIAWRRGRRGRWPVLELGLKAQAGEPLAAELDAAKRHIGELSMEIELLRERARAAECRLPLATRRSRR